MNNHDSFLQTLLEKLGFTSEEIVSIESSYATTLQAIMTQELPWDEQQNVQFLNMSEEDKKSTLMDYQLNHAEELAQAMKNIHDRIDVFSVEFLTTLSISLPTEDARNTLSRALTAFSISQLGKMIPDIMKAGE